MTLEKSTHRSLTVQTGVELSKRVLSFQVIPQRNKKRSLAPIPLPLPLHRLSHLAALSNLTSATAATISPSTPAPPPHHWRRPRPATTTGYRRRRPLLPPCSPIQPYQRHRHHNIPVHPSGTTTYIAGRRPRPEATADGPCRGQRIGVGVEMKLASNVVKYYGKLRWQFGQSSITRSYSVNRGLGNTSSGRQSNDTFESADDFENRIFGNISGSNEETNSFFRNLDKIERARGKGAGSFSSGSGGQNNHQLLDGLEDTFSALSDGMDGKLKKAATYFAFGDEIIGNEEYKFRPDVTFPSGREGPGLTYTTEDLDLTKPGIQKEINKRPEFETTTKEVLEKADFRNVRFLANFITAAGILKKRKMTGISAKAQRKVAREIKTARAFGLMPFTTMGQKPFKFGQSMKETYDDFNYGPPMRGRWGMPLKREAESLDVDSLIGSNLDDALDMPDPRR